MDSDLLTPSISPRVALRVQADRNRINEIAWLLEQENLFVLERNNDIIPPSPPPTPELDEWIGPQVVEDIIAEMVEAVIERNI